MKKTIVIIFVIAVLASCAAAPKVPEVSENPLVAGKLFVKTNNLGPGVSNSSKSLGIRIRFENEETNKITTVTSQSDGWILTTKLPAGRYRIEDMILKLQGMELTLFGPFYLIIDDGGVNNMGFLNINVESKIYNFNFGNYSNVKEEFLTTFPDSIWNSSEWKDRIISQNR